MASSHFEYHPYGKSHLDSRFYEDLDCFISLSPYESFSLSSLEAMAARVPVVSSKLNGVFLEKSLQGERFLTEIKDVSNMDETGDLIAKILLEENFRDRAIEQGINFCSKYAWENASRIQEETYSQYHSHL